MTYVPRDYQIKDEAAIYAAYAAGAKNVVYQCPTGGGKTPVGAKFVKDRQGVSAVIAHRSELVLQMSMALCLMEVRHRIIASKVVTQFIIREQRREFGRDYYDINGRAAVVAVDTLNARADKLADWARQVGFWVMDECKHLLRENKWGKAVKMFPNAYGLGLDATPNRADGKGIGRHAEGVFDAMVSGPTVSELMEQDYLSRYKIYAPESDFDISSLRSGGTGDYTRDSMIKETARSHIVGDVVENYFKFANGTRAIVFAVDIESSNQITSQFIAAGVKAVAVNGKSKDRIREEMVRRFRTGELDVLVNVDLFGEGFDVPACETIIGARPTMSLPLYLQMFGRCLRPFDGKPFGIFIDHVGNVKRHGLPDTYREWDLNNRNKQARSKRDPDVMPIAVCPECRLVYEAITNCCPFCGHIAEPAGRSLPEQVDGDLCELSEETLERLRNQVANIHRDGAQLEHGLVLGGKEPHVAKVIAGHHVTRQAAHVNLHNTINWWAGHGQAQGKSDSEMYRRFYHTFGVDVLSAQALSRVDAEALTIKIQERL